MTTRDSKYMNRIQGRLINPLDPAFCAISPFSWSPRSRDRTRVPTTDRSRKSGTIWHYLALFQGSSLPISKAGNDLRFRANRLVPLFAPNRVVSSVGTSPKPRVSKELGIVASSGTGAHTRHGAVVPFVRIVSRERTANASGAPSFEGRAFPRREGIACACSLRTNDRDLNQWIPRSSTPLELAGRDVGWPRRAWHEKRAYATVSGRRQKGAC